MKTVILYIIQYCLLASLVISGSVQAEESIDMKGLSIIGNKELPNVLYIVPWKSPELPDMNEPPLATLINAALEPVNREAILRKELYYQIMDARKSELLNKSNKQQ